MKHITFLLTVLLATPIFASDWTVFVVDTSGSMRGNRITTAKDSMSKVVDQIPEGTQVGLLSFNGWEYKPTTLNKESLKKSISGMRTGGGTPLSDYMKAGADQLLLARKRGDRGGVYTLIVVTDGVEDDPRQLKNYLDEIILRGIQVKAIGLDMSGDHNLASNPAVEYTNANNPEALTKKLTDYVKAEVDFSDPQASEEMFEELEGLPGEVAFKVIESITKLKNHPIGEPEVVEVIDEQGNAQTIPNEPATVAEQQAAAEGGIGVFAIIGIIGGILLLVVVGITALARH